MTTTPAPARVLVLALTGAEVTVLTDALAHERGDDPATAAVIGRLQAAITDAAPDPSSPLLQFTAHLEDLTTQATVHGLRGPG